MSNVNLYFFFFKDTATPEIYTLSLHDALPIFAGVLGEEECLLHRRVAPADDSYLLLLEEESVARSAAAHPPAHQAPLARQPEPLGLRPRSDDDGPRESRLLLTSSAPLSPQLERALGEVHPLDVVGAHLGTEARGLRLEVVHHLRS